MNVPVEARRGRTVLAERVNVSVVEYTDPANPHRPELVVEIRFDHERVGVVEALSIRDAHALAEILLRTGVPDRTSDVQRLAAAYPGTA